MFRLLIGFFAVCTIGYGLSFVDGIDAAYQAGSTQAIVAMAYFSITGATLLYSVIRYRNS